MDDIVCQMFIPMKVKTRKHRALQKVAYRPGHLCLKGNLNNFLETGQEFAQIIFLDLSLAILQIKMLFSSVNKIQTLFTSE